MKKFSVVVPAYNEEQNVGPLSEAIAKLFQEKLSNYDYEIIFIDNSSSDSTVSVVKSLSQKNSKIKLIVNSRNFGHIRSPYHGILQGQGDAVIFMACDFQDPPEMIEKFVSKWEEGHKVVIGVKNQSEESPLMFMIRSLYYRLVARLAEIDLEKNFTGFGLYDRVVVEKFRMIKDPYPYFRGIVFEVGYEPERIPFVQPKRKRGITKNNFYSLYDMAMLGICSHTKIPLRIATMTGFVVSILSLLVGFGYLIAKLIFWDNFVLGTAPVLIGIFFFASVQLFFLGILGEYIGFIYTKVHGRPLVFEKERFNFESDQLDS